MKKITSYKAAAYICIFAFAVFVLMHSAVILGILFFDVVPVDYLWGGRLDSAQQLLRYEIVSLAISGLCLLTTLIETGRLKITALRRPAHLCMWLFFALFVLSTVGNLLAKTLIEKTFAVPAALLAVSTLRLAIEKPEQQK